MSKKYALEALVVVVLLGALTILPVVLPDQLVQSPYWKIGLVVLWLLAIVAFWIRGNILTKEDRAAENHRKKRETERDNKDQERDRQSTALFDEVKRLTQENTEQTELLKQLGNTLADQERVQQKIESRATEKATLPVRIRELAQELWSFLGEFDSPPNKPPLMADGLTWEQRWADYWDKKYPLEQRINAGYSAHYAERISKIRHEIIESGTDASPKLNELIEKRYHDSGTIQAIATSLLEISVRMTTNELVRRSKRA